MNEIPSGKERKVIALGGAAIDGAPISYVVALATVVAALAFIPFSVVLSLGGSFPLSQCVYSLVGWILGPIAGALTSGIGVLIGILIAPHTSPVPAVSIWGAIFTSFTAGAMVLGDRRKGWWLISFILGGLGLLAYVGRAVLVNGVDMRVALGATAVNWLSLLLYATPLRRLIARQIQRTQVLWLSVGLAVGTFMTYGVAHVTQSAALYWIMGWPEAVWLTLLPVVPVEFFFRALVGAVIGAIVIAGLRSLGLVKSTWSLY